MKTALFAVALLGAARTATSQEALKIAMTDSIRAVSAGTAASLMFTIDDANGGGGSISLTLPTGWRSLTPDTELPVGSRRITFVAGAAIPGTAAPGRYRVELTVAQGTRIVRAGGWLTVAQINSISLAKIEVPDMVVAGSPIDARFLLTNRGNARARVRVRVKSPQLGVSDSSIIELAPGEGTELPIEVKTAVRTQLVHATTSVAAQIIDTSAPVVRQSFQVTLAPRAAFSPAPLNVLSSRIRLIGSPSPVGGSGAELLGAGRLTDRSPVQVEYVARRMSGQQSIYGERDEYRLAIQSSTFRATAGHQTMRLSRLSESGRYAAGVSGEVKSNGWTLGAFANRDAYRTDKPEERAAFLNRDFGNGTTLDVNYLDRKERRGGKMITVHTNIRSLPIGTVDAEVGHAISGRAAEAWSISTHARFERLSYSASKRNTDAAYPGATRGSASTNASVDMRPVKKVQLHASIDDNTLRRGSFSLDSGTARYWNRTAAITLVSRLTLRLIQNGRADSSFRAQPVRQETLAQARYSAHFGSASVQATATVGSARDTANTSRPLQRYSAGATFSPLPRTTVGIDAEVIRGGTLFLATQQSEFQGGVRLTVEPRKGTVLSIAARGGEHRLPERKRDASFDATLGQDLPSGQHVALTARFRSKSLDDTREENFVRAEITIPFGLPVSPATTRGRVNGRLYNNETGAPVPKAIVQLGKQVTVTDSKGRFAFSANSEDEVMLTLGGSSALSGLIAVRDLPLLVTPRMGRTSEFEIALTKASRVEGVARLFVSRGFAMGEALPAIEDTLGLRRSRVFLTMGKETKAAVTNARGAFVFSDLRPGRWILRVSPADVPLYSKVDDDSVIVDVAPGELKRTEIVVRPRARQIRLVEGS